MKYINYLLLLVVSVIWLSIFSIDGNLHIIVCDVGQGDAILITYKNTQILTDGGPDNKVLTCLGKYMPVYDRKLELVILTHPQADHYTGLIEVFRRYKVDNYLHQGASSSSQSYEVLEKLVGSSGTRVVRSTKETSIRLGLIYLDILIPEDVQGIVYLLKYKDFKALFTADYEKEIDIVEKVDYIKVNHHGSKNGLTENLLKVAMPKTAVISVGKNNRYGHPHQEVLEMLKKYNVKIYRTDEIGNVDYVVK